MARQPDVRYIRLYTDGSAARKIETIAPVKTAQLPKIRKQKKIVLWIDPVAVLALAVAAVMMILMVVGVTKLHEAQQQTAAMEQYVQQLQERNETLRTAYAEGYDLEEVERTAHALGMVPTDHVKHVTIQVQTPEAAPKLTLWEQIGTFLAGLFA